MHGGGVEGIAPPISPGILSRARLGSAVLHRGVQTRRALVSNVQPCDSTDPQKYFPAACLRQAAGHRDAGSSCEQGFRILLVSLRYWMLDRSKKTACWRRSVHQAGVKAAALQKPIIGRYAEAQLRFQACQVSQEGRQARHLHMLTYNPMSPASSSRRVLVSR